MAELGLASEQRSQPVISLSFLVCRPARSDWCDDADALACFHARCDHKLPNTNRENIQSFVGTFTVAKSKLVLMQIR